MKHVKNHAAKLLIAVLAIVGLCSTGIRVEAAPQQTITVGTNAEYAPFEYLDSNGDLTGFDIDLMEAIAKEEGAVIDWRDMPFDSLVGSMEAGDIKVIAAAVGPTKERAKSVDFSDIYYTGSQSIISKEADAIDNFEDLSGKTISVLEGAQSDLIASGETTDYGEVKDAKVKRFKTASSAIMELKNGGADAVIIDTIMADIFCSQTEGLVAFKVDGTEEDTVFCIEKGNTELKALIDDGLKKVHENGVYDQLYAQYFGGDDSGSVADPEAETVEFDPITVSVGTNAEYAPFEYLDSDGNLTGFDIDLVNAIGEKTNMTIEWKDMPFDSLIGSMEAGDTKIVAAAVGPTKERAKSVDFSDIYYTGSQSIISKEDNPFSTFEELSGKNIAVLEGAQSDLIASGETTDYGEVKDAKVKRFKTASSASMELKNGGADAVIIDTIMAELFCKQTDGLTSVKVDGTEEDTVLCIEKGNTALVERVNAGLKALQEDGTYDELYAQYFGGEEGSVSDTALEVPEESADEGTEAAVETVDEKEEGFFGLLKFIFINENRYQYYINGLGVTLLVSLLSVIVGTIIGLFVAIIRINADRKNKKTILSSIMSIYVDIIRGTPSVLQLMIIYFAVFHSRLGYVAAVLSFGINSGAYVSEVIRGGIMAVDKGQNEAGRSLGISYANTMRYIIIPQAIKTILPAMGNEFIQLIKETSILGYVGIVDLTKASSYVSSRTYQMFIPLVAAGIMYYAIVKILSILLRIFERRLRESD